MIDDRRDDNDEDRRTGGVEGLLILLLGLQVPLVALLPPGVSRNILFSCFKIQFLSLISRQ